MTHPTIQRKKDRMCRRFGHVPGVTFRTMKMLLATYCQRCGECVPATVQPCATHEGR